MEVDEEMKERLIDMMAAKILLDFLIVEKMALDYQKATGKDPGPYLSRFLPKPE